MSVYIPLATPCHMVMPRAREAGKSGLSVPRKKGNEFGDQPVLLPHCFPINPFILVVSFEYLQKFTEASLPIWSIQRAFIHVPYSFIFTLIAI